MNSKRQNRSLRIGPQFLLGPVISNKKELTSFQLYFKNYGELFSLLQEKIALYLLKQRQLEEKGWKNALIKEEHSIRSLVHFILDKKIATRQEVLTQLNRMQLNMRSLYEKIIQ